MKHIFFIILFFLLLASITFASKPSLTSEKWPPKDYLVYYGSWDNKKISQAMDFNLIILHPGRKHDNITPDLIKTLKNGKDKKTGTDDDILVLAYISIGEDEKMPGGPGNPSKIEKGPVYWNDKIITMNKNYPSRFLDEITYVFNDKGFFNFLPNGNPEIKKGHDGLPDENGKWHSYFVYGGDGEWQEILKKKMTLLSGKFSVDGFFLDTLDTSSPWGNYGWMERDMAFLVKKIREDFPYKYIIVNRGLSLFEKYGDILRPAIDGLMFESFISEWNYDINAGSHHAYLESNRYVLNNFLLPEIKKPDGFHLFFLNYLNPSQRDFYNIISDQFFLLKDIPYSHYISTPDLQKIYPPPDRYFKKDKEPLPVIKKINIFETGKGAFNISFQFSDNKLKAGKDLFFDIRYGEKDITDSEIPFLKSLPINYSILKDEHINIKSYGLDKDKTYYFYIKPLGKNPLFMAEYEKIKLHTSKGEYGGILSSLKAEGRERAVYLSWDKAGDVRNYNVYFGSSPEKLKFYKKVKDSFILIDGLKNDMPYYFSVASVSGGEDEGCLLFPVIASPHDCTPPVPPDNLELTYKDGKLYVNWKHSSDNTIEGYYVYCFPSEEKIRLPLITYKTSAIFSGLIKGKSYTIFVTSFDGSNNQSQPQDKKVITIP